jgi:hypothetical protein
MPCSTARERPYNKLAFSKESFVDEFDKLQKVKDVTFYGATPVL